MAHSLCHFSRAALYLAKKRVELSWKREPPPLLSANADECDAERSHRQTDKDRRSPIRAQRVMAMEEKWVHRHTHCCTKWQLVPPEFRSMNHTTVLSVKNVYICRISVTGQRVRKREKERERKKKGLLFVVIDLHCLEVCTAMLLMCLSACLGLSLAGMMAAAMITVCALPPPPLNTSWQPFISGDGRCCGRQSHTSRESMCSELCRGVSKHRGVTWQDHLVERERREECRIKLFPSVCF